MVELNDVNPEQQHFIRFVWLQHGRCFLDGETGFMSENGYTGVMTDEGNKIQSMG
jgi:hypothetical protein